MADTQAVVMFNGHKYRTSILLQNGKVAPLIKVKAKELAANNPTIAKIIGLIPEGPVLLYKHDNKYYVLAGTVDIESDTVEIEGHFVSSVNLKKAKVESNHIAPAPAAPKPYANQRPNNNFNSRPQTTQRFGSRGR